MWAGRRPAHILIKPLPKLFFGGPKIGKKLQGEGKGSVLKSRAAKGLVAQPPPGPLGLVGGLVGLFVGCWSNIEQRLAHINQTLVICCWSDLAPLWAIDQMLAIYRPKLNYI